MIEIPRVLVGDISESYLNSFRKSFSEAHNCENVIILNLRDSNYIIKYCEKENAKNA